MEEEDKTTEWALLFPLKAGLFAMKSSTMSRTESRKTHHHLSSLGINLHKKTSRKKSAEAEPEMEPPTGQRMRMRRGSSMSELDKIQLSGGVGLPDLIRSSTNQSQLGSAQSTLMLKGYGSVPHSPALSRSLVSATRTSSTQGSIGDLMNLKKFGGSSWSVRSETLVAKAVPLSTVTPKISPGSPTLPSPPTPPPMPRPEVCTAALTAAQRTQRLSRLLRDTRPPPTPPKRKVNRLIMVAGLCLLCTILIYCPL